MSEQAVWSADVCTCGHEVGAHDDRGVGRCEECDEAAHWGEPAHVCVRYQWNGEPRRRVW